MVDVAGIGGAVLNIVIIIVSIIFGGSIVGAIVWLYMRWRRHREFKCVIWGKDAFGQTYEKYDQAGIYVDGKTNNKRLYLKKNKVGLQADNVPYIQSGKNKIIYLHQFGLKNFRFIKPKVTDRIDFEVGEEDVNWGLNAYERGKKIFSFDKMAQYMPFILLAFVSVIILILFIYLFRKFDVLADIFQTTNQMVQNAKELKAGTVIVQ